MLRCKRFECNIRCKTDISDLFEPKTKNIKKNKGGNRVMCYMGEKQNSHVYFIEE